MSKSATKVLAPPGGKTSINVFSYEVENQSRPINKCQAARSRSQVFPGYEPCHDEAQDNEEKQVRKQLDAINITEDEIASHVNGNSNGHAIDANGEAESDENHEIVNGNNAQETTIEDDSENTTEEECSPNDKDDSATEKAVNVCQLERNKSSVFATEGDEEKKFQRKFSPPPQKPPEDRPKTATRVLSPPGGVTSISLFGDGGKNTSTASMDGNNNGQKHGDYRSSSFDHVFGGGEGKNDDACGRRRAYTPRSTNNIFG